MRDLHHISFWRRSWLFLVVLATLLFLILPIFVVIPVSFSDSQYLTFPPPGYSLRWYSAFIESREWQASLRASLTAATLTMLVATPIGMMAAYAINAASPRWARLAYGAVLLPLIVPHILIAIAVFYVYIKLRVVNSMPSIVFAHALLAIPIVTITVLAGLKSFDMKQEMVARSLGASRLGAFFFVTLPQIAPSVVCAAVFAFATSLDEVIVSLFVAGGENTVLTRRMFVALRDAITPTVAAISTIIIVASLIIAGLILLLNRRTSR